MGMTCREMKADCGREPSCGPGAGPLARFTFKTWARRRSLKPVMHQKQLLVPVLVGALTGNACHKAPEGNANATQGQPAASEAHPNPAPTAASIARVGSATPPPSGPAKPPATRADCTRAPFLPSPTDAPTVLGMEHHACTVSRVNMHVLERQGGPEATEPELLSLTERLAALLPKDAVLSRGSMSCCTDSTKSCAHLTIQLCSISLEGAADLVRKALSEPEFQNRTVRVAFGWEGRSEPFCKGPDCGPAPYGDPSSRSTTEALLRAERMPLKEKPARNVGGACQEDGDCGVVGAPNACGSYATPHSEVGPSIDYPSLRGSYCGCVQGTCQWFRPTDEGASRKR